MAFRSIGNLGSLMGRLRGSATYATSTTPKAKAYAPTADHATFEEHYKQTKTKLPKPVIKGDYVPVYVAIGMIVLSASLGLYTAKHQLMHSPGVRVKKKTRETVPEVYDPDKVVDEAGRFVNKSFFRKVAHVQEFDLPMPDRKDAFAHQSRADTLTSVGVDPNQV